MDPVLLSRVQFALTIMFHYLFPPLTIGMGVVMAYLEGMFLRTRDPIYETAARFWTNIFALNFAIGVASGIVMEFQFGTNWAVYSRFVGDVFGSALAAEGIFAFFLESGFLAVLVFGWNRVSPGFHFFATCMVSLGSMFSAVWIIVANSWQQTPAGHRLVPVLREGLSVNGQSMMRAETVDFWQVVFNPSTANRLSHTLIGAFILGSFFILSISAYYLLRRRHEEFARRSFSGALIFATAASLLALITGDLSARQVYRTQPAKLAAFEGHFKTGPADLSLFGIPDEQQERVRMKIAVPGGLSLMLHHDPKKPVVGLDRFEPRDRPPVGLCFLSFHTMVALGTAFIGLTLLASFLRWRGKLFQQRWLLWVFVFAVVGPFITNQAGWVSAEVGRQPWVVYPPTTWTPDGDVVTTAAGVVDYGSSQIGLRTQNAVSESVVAGQVLGAIIMFSVIYGLLFVLWVYLLDRKIRHGPEPAPMPGSTSPEGLLDTAGVRTGHKGSMTTEPQT
jgi:cytochrome bd ubiquinol oxidase subunit I